MQLASWKECFEGRLDYSGFSSVKVSYEEGFYISKHAAKCEYEKCLVTWMKLESLLLSWEENPFEEQGAGSCFLKVRR